MSYIGDILPDYGGYHKSEGTFNIAFGRGTYNAEIPFTIESWINYDEQANINVLVNKSPITGWTSMSVSSNKKSLDIYMDGFSHTFNIKPCRIILNVTTPHMPIVSDGKAPSFHHMSEKIIEAVDKAAKRAKKFIAKLPNARTKKPSQKSIILDNLQAAIDKASGNGQYPFSLRQVYYAIRPYVITELGGELEYSNFTSIITDYENENGNISNLYRDNRGVLYHPHTGQQIPIGTLTVREYMRPKWTFNKILYCEKEGLFPLLKQVKFPERFDCALVTSKGFASRAVKDLLDMLGESEEELQFFCIHDADAAGTKIYETLVEETKARPGRKVNVINLGLDPKEAITMGLEIEKLEKKEREKPVAAYMAEWKDWLQTNRIELNAMTSDQFILWLETKMEPYTNGKLVPDTDTLKQKMEATVRSRLEGEIRERILREARYHEQVQQQMESLVPALNECTETLADEVSNMLNDQPELFWAHVVEHIGNEMRL